MIRCPHCGESYYRENYTTMTALFWAPIFKDGVMINSNPNTQTTHCTCLNCGKDFSYNSKEQMNEYSLYANES